MKKKRILAIWVDFIIISLIGNVIILLIEEILDKYNISSLYYDYAIYVFSYILICLKYLIYKNTSIGKKIFGLKVLTNDNEIPKKSTLVLRNIFCVIWPIEIILILIRNKKIGDLIFKTKIV